MVVVSEHNMTALPVSTVTVDALRSFEPIALHHVVGVPAPMLM
jgi:hypothetical protein